MINTLLRWLVSLADRPTDLKNDTLYKHNGVILSIAEDGTFLFSLKNPSNPKNPVIMSLNALHNLKVFEEFENSKDQAILDSIPQMTKKLDKEYLVSLPNSELSSILEHSLAVENYELSAIIRDIMDDRNNKQDGNE